MFLNFVVCRWKLPIYSCVQHEVYLIKNMDQFAVSLNVLVLRIPPFPLSVKLALSRKEANSIICMFTVLNLESRKKNNGRLYVVEFFMRKCVWMVEISFDVRSVDLLHYNSSTCFKIVPKDGLFIWPKNSIWISENL